MILLSKQMKPMDHVMNNSHSQYSSPNSPKNTFSSPRSSPRLENLLSKKDKLAKNNTSKKSFKRCSVTSILNPVLDSSLSKKKTDPSSSIGKYNTTKIIDPSTQKAKKVKTVPGLNNNRFPVQDKMATIYQTASSSNEVLSVVSQHIRPPQSVKTNTFNSLPPMSLGSYNSVTERPSLPQSNTNETNQQYKNQNSSNYASYSPHFNIGARMACVTAQNPPSIAIHSPIAYKIPPLGSCHTYNNTTISGLANVVTPIPQLQELASNSVRSQQTSKIGNALTEAANATFGCSTVEERNFDAGSKEDKTLVSNSSTKEYSKDDTKIQLDPQKYPLTTALLSNSLINKNKKKKGGYRCSGSKCKDSCTFATIVDLAKHLDKLQINNEYKCYHDNCFYKYIGFSTSGSLKRHLKIHENGSDVFHCRFCDKSFKNVFNKHRHEKYLHKKYLQGRS